MIRTLALVALTQAFRAPSRRCRIQARRQATDGDELARIHMKYLKSGADVEWLLDSLPLLCADGAGVDAARLPNAIIIDDLDELLLAREVGAAAPAGCAATAEHGGLFPSSDAALSRANTHESALTELGEPLCL